MNADPRFLVGLDLGSRQHEVVICDEQGERVRRFSIGRGRGGQEQLEREVSAVLAGGGRAEYVVEAAQNFWQEIIHPLHAAGQKVYLVDPTKCSDLRKFYSRHTKTDTIDAQATARLPLTDRHLRPVWVGTPEQESLRRLCRLSWKLTEQMCNQKRRLSTMLEMVLPGIGEVWKNNYCGSARLFYRRYLEAGRARRLGRKRLGAILRRRAYGKFPAQAEEKLWAVIQNAPALRYRGDDLMFEVQCELDLLENLEHRQQVLRERIEELYGEVDPAHRLEHVPGLGYFLAAALTSAIGDVRRWGSADSLVAASGLVPRKKASSGHEKAHQPLTKRGDPQLRCWLYVAAEIVRHYDPELQAFFLRLRRRGLHHKAAICAVAAKLLRRLYAVLRDQTEYRRVEQDRIKNGKKPIRESVHEVAEELLKDKPDEASCASSKLAPPSNESKMAPSADTPGSRGEESAAQNTPYLEYSPSPDRGSEGLP
jgi:transposase